MPKQSGKQKSVIGRVMHEFKHGELETAQGKKVKSQRQAVAIGLHEAGCVQVRKQAPKQEEPASHASARKKAGQDCQLDSNLPSYFHHIFRWQ